MIRLPNGQRHAAQISFFLRMPRRSQASRRLLVGRKPRDFALALSTYKKTLAVGAPDELNQGVGDTRGAFTTGRCALSLDWGDIGTLALGTYAQDKTGAVITPGWTQRIPLIHGPSPYIKRSMRGEYAARLAILVLAMSLGKVSGVLSGQPGAGATPPFFQ